MPTVPTVDEAALLESVYFNIGNPAGFGSVQSLAKATKLPRKKVEAWLKKQRTYTTHKPARIHFPTRSYVTRGLNHQWQADLVEMRPFARENQGYHYLLTVIDIFSRYAMVRPLKRKTPNEVIDAFKSIFRDEPDRGKPHYLQTDEGMEFESRAVRAYLRSEGIEQFSVKSQFKASIVERFNRTLKSRMWRVFTHRGNYRWMDILQPLVEAYNRSHHRVLGRTPIEVNKDNETRVWLHLYGKVKKPNARKKTKFKVGDRVRLSKVKGHFEKGYRPNWTEEIFTVHSVNRKYLPITYTVRDWRDEIIEGSFYAHELQEVDDNEQVYTVEKVIRTRGKGQRKEYLVKWLGYDETSWVKERDFKHLT